VATDDDDLLGEFEVADDCIEHRNEVWADDEHFGLSVVHDEGNLRRCKSEVDVNADCVQQRTSVEHLEVLNGVLVKECDAILTADARRLQRLGDL
jgi:hypothetical protein